KMVYPQLLRRKLATSAGRNRSSRSRSLWNRTFQIKCEGKKNDERENRRENIARDHKIHQSATGPRLSCLDGAGAIETMVRTGKRTHAQFHRRREGWRGISLGSR